MTEAKTLAYKDMQVAYTLGGRPNGETIVFFHPAFADQTVFASQRAHFEPNYRVITLDMVAHGQSQLHREHVDMGDMPDIVKAICADCGVAKAHLVGVSLGSLVAQGVAYMHPELAASVTVVGGYSIHKANADVLKAQKKEILRWVWRMLIAFDALKKDLVLKSASTIQGREILARSIDSFSRRSFRGMGGMNRFFVSSDTPVCYPLLIVVGEYDLPLTLEAGRRLAELEPSSRFEYVAGAGHCVNIDNPSVFNAVLASFLAELKQSMEKKSF